MKLHLLAAATFGLVLSCAAPAHADVQYVYDSSGRVIRAIYSNGVTVEYRYDAAGNRIRVFTDPPPGSARAAPRPDRSRPAPTRNASTANEAPVAHDKEASATINTSQIIEVLNGDTDANGDTLTVTGVSTATGGSARVGEGGGYVVFDAPPTPGSYAFSYTVSDSQGATDTAAVTVHVFLGEMGEAVPDASNGPP